MDLRKRPVLVPGCDGACEAGEWAVLVVVCIANSWKGMQGIAVREQARYRWVVCKEVERKARSAGAG